MTDQDPSGTVEPFAADLPAELAQLALPRSEKVVLVMDLVESVRLMAADEVGTIDRWRRFLAQATSDVLPAHQGRLVKSLGDGLMAEFSTPRQAVGAAMTMHQLLARSNGGYAAERHLVMRAGVNSTHVYSDDLDIYGHGVNLAARLATLANPGETVASTSVRDGLTAGLDANIEDLGECYLKHIDRPVRAWSILPCGSAAPKPQHADQTVELRPTVAVIPFELRSQDAAHFAIGDMIADGVIAQLSRTGDLRVISRLSTAAFRGRESSSMDIRRHLGVNYVLAGSYILVGTKVVVSAELTDLQKGDVVWADRIVMPVADLFSEQSEINDRIANAAHHTLLEREVSQARGQPLPTLQSHSLLIGAVNMMHRTARSDFFKSHELLQHLQQRHQRVPAVSAWLAKWHVLQVEQGWSDDPKAVVGRALDNSKRALDLDSESPLALCIDGFVRCNLMRDFDSALKQYERALQVNPNESLAWLFKGMLHAFRGEGALALEAADKAVALSPLDPARYFYDSLSASIHLSAGDYVAAIGFAKQSLRANASHVSTFRALTIAQVMAGEVEQARTTSKSLLRLDPDFSVSRFLARSPGVDVGPGKIFAEALRTAGVPN